MQDPEDLVVAATAGSPPIAQLLAQILRERGVEAYVPGVSLQDEFAVSQAALGRSASEVRVFRKDLEHARRILAELREAAGEGGPASGTAQGAEGGSGE